MRLDRDTFREIADSLTRNRTRSLLTGFGIFWGIFMLIFLLGGGNGINEMLAKLMVIGKTKTGVDIIVIITYIFNICIIFVIQLISSYIT